MNRKTEQLASSLRRVLGELIGRGLSDPRIQGLVSVTGVQLVAKGRTAEVGVSVLPAEHGPLALQGLNSAAAHLRSKVGDVLRLRVCPEIRFVLDDSLKNQADVLGAIREAVGAEEVPDPVQESDEQEQTT